MVIADKDITEALQNEMEKKPTKEQLERFYEYLKLDINQWLRDNAKSFLYDEGWNKCN